MPVRMIQREELLEFERLESVAFVYPMDTAETEKRLEKDSEPQEPCIGHFNDDGVLTACMVLPEYRMRYEGHWVPMVGIGGVASLPEYRFGGAIRQIFQAAFRRMVESGVVFSALYPFSHAYYRKFGYELCQTTTGYELPVQALSAFRYDGKVRMIRPGESLDGLKAVFEAHFLDSNLAIQREDRHWTRLLGKDAYKERVYTYLLEDENGPSAYVVLAAEDAGPFEKNGNVREIAYVRPRGLTDALGFLYRLSAQYGKLRILLPDGVPLPALLPESYDVKAGIREQPMARVIDVKQALLLKRHFDGARYTLRVRDEILPENDGVFAVRCEGGEVSVEKREDGEADLSLDVRTLTQLLLGYLSLDEALYKADVSAASNLDTLRRVFVKRSVLLTEHF